MKTLTTAAELQQAIAGPQAPLIIDVRWVLSAPDGSGITAGAQREAYLAGHIPGAQFVDLEADLTGPLSGEPLAADGGRHPLPTVDQLTATVQRLGLTPQTPVVIYDGGNGMSAARTWWLLRDAGVVSVHVLDGGWPAWLAAGGASESGEAPAVAPSTWVPTPGAFPRVDADEVTRRIAAGARVLDVRAGERFRGETEPMDPVAGHIPGAESLPDGLLVKADGTRRPDTDLRAAVGDLGADAVIYCGSGVTASHACLVLVDAGYDLPAIYPGSWSEWSRQGREVATGA